MLHQTPQGRKVQPGYAAALSETELTKLSDVGRRMAREWGELRGPVAWES